MKDRFMGKYVKCMSLKFQMYKIQMSVPKISRKAIEKRATLIEDLQSIKAIFNEGKAGKFHNFFLLFHQ